MNRKRMNNFLGNLAIAAFLLGWHTVASPAAITQSCVVTGSGADQRAAILDGLVQAIEQVNGVRIEQKSLTQRRYADAIDDLKETFKASIVNSTEIRTASKGLIDSYDLNGEQQETPTGNVQVRMTVRVSQYDP